MCSVSGDAMSPLTYAPVEPTLSSAFHTVGDLVGELTL